MIKHKEKREACRKDMEITEQTSRHLKLNFHFPKTTSTRQVLEYVEKDNNNETNVTTIHRLLRKNLFILEQYIKTTSNSRKNLYLQQFNLLFCFFFKEIT